jgi:hypothetical protein
MLCLLPTRMQATYACREGPPATAQLPLLLAYLYLSPSLLERKWLFTLPVCVGAPGQLHAQNAMHALVSGFLMHNLLSSTVTCLSSTLDMLNLISIRRRSLMQRGPCLRLKYATCQ